MFDSVGLPLSYLGEGQTPLVERSVEGYKFFGKLESLNPSGSFKDRNAAMLVSILSKRGIKTVVEDSSGNAGSALALYASAFGIASRIFVPAGTTGPKIEQIRKCGADIVEVPGARQNAREAVQKAIQEGLGVYASHAELPFGMAAYATIAFEIFEQLGRMPGRVFCPIGHGSLFYGILLGFEALAARIGAVVRPAMVGVQPERCAPLVAAWRGQEFNYQGQPSLAEGTVISNPVRKTEILEALIPEFDSLIDVTEQEIADSQLSLSTNGIYVEPTSAMVYAALKKVEYKDNDFDVLVFTGNGLKSYH